MLVLAAALALVSDSPALSDEHYNWTDKMMYTTDQVCPWVIAHPQLGTVNLLKKR
jgi:hypothetical protein